MVVTILHNLGGKDWQSLLFFIIMATSLFILLIIIPRSSSMASMKKGLSVESLLEKVSTFNTLH